MTGDNQVAHIKVYYRDILKDEVEIDSDITTIGRSYDSDIIIDNAGVSAHHARIIRKGDDFIIEDDASRNGIYVNGKRITSQPLHFEDDVEISKHILKLTTAPGLGTPPVHPMTQGEQTVQGATLEVDASQLGELMKHRQARMEAYLLLIGVVQMRTKYPLNKITFTIGRGNNADMYTPGWFAPRMSAQIFRKNDGYYINPKVRGRVRVNGMPVSAMFKLDDGDTINVRSLSFKFLVKQPDKTRPPE
jgi:predicted component of type VI protein secretion system